MSATTTTPSGGLLRKVGGAVTGWWFTPLPLARVAVFRVLVYAFVVFDVLFVANDVIPHGYTPDLYQPTLLGRVLHLPPLGVAGGWALLVVLVAACVLGIVATTSTRVSGRVQLVTGWTVAVAFWVWMLNSQGFAYVSHDHLALMVAVAVLPTVGVARPFDVDTSQAAGWALRCTQIAVVLTYFGSAFSKWIRSGSPQAWANGAVFVWAIMRRGSDLVTWTLQFPWILRLGQWGLLAIEFLSPVVLFLRGKWLYLAVATFCAFHLATYLALGIHFLPTVICWAAFLPLEKLPVWLRARFTPRAPGGSETGTASA
ncbi:conserved hypothetical protein [Beutenbergia cavernae DSM 12333]|uniref:HTTM domain protein n=1 Tax=Beutenbergia cavernae (strain ATCC BAA-8 / DSM 12333 / CCUG 43141 / JCM 11478 / NBRC 16432 / NCIMB 13614 / HKI 0122) TaxID=471853 RepID=C5BZA8_BEUC1|nr:hypothetical protein [Beutenbergia cavernae]ACQ79080.1 conserved hypothetical protein [Beutenbergia cavernae DSM 12333]